MRRLSNCQRELGLEPIRRRGRCADRRSNSSGWPARRLQLRSPLSDYLRLEPGENTCTLEREACRRAADPFAGFPLHFVGMRALEVGAEKLVAGEILERTLDHGHGQVSFRREGPNYGLGLHRQHAEILARSLQEWQASVLVEAYAAELLVLRRWEEFHREALGFMPSWNSCAC
jgi:hypothetical protein